VTDAPPPEVIKPEVISSKAAPVTSRAGIHGSGNVRAAQRLARGEVSTGKMGHIGVAEWCRRFLFSLCGGPKIQVQSAEEK
jgi:hypothetical protein